MYNGASLTGGGNALNDLAGTLDVETRGLQDTNITTTLQAGLGWIDDRENRRVE